MCKSVCLGVRGCASLFLTISPSPLFILHKARTHKYSQTHAIARAHTARNTNYPLFYPYYDQKYCPGGDPLKCSNRNLKFRFELELSS